jgi:F-type H+-transporting ATPase subunit a
MPKHTYWLTYLLDQFPALKANAKNLGDSVIGHQHPDYRATEPVLTSLLYMAILVLLALVARPKILKVKEAAVPSDRLNLETFFEVFLGYFYGMAKDVMGASRAKRFFPIIGASALFIIFSNFAGLIPGVGSPTSSLNVTLGCAVVVFLAFNYYGLKENGWGYIAHLAGPKWYLAPLIFPIEVISTCVRPVTLSIRLMVNIAVDHLLASIFIGLVTLLVPVPIMFLGIIVCIVQTVVFCLLSCVYIGLATEHDEHH